jgi:drug/metabolite transporter (DMT)-like permease
VICLATGTQLWGFSTRDWWLIIAITVLAQFGGHTLMNMALRSFSATAVSLAILVEVPGATLFGWVWPGQTPPWQLLPAAALILVGLAIVSRASRTQDVGST